VFATREAPPFDSMCGDPKIASDFFQRTMAAGRGIRRDLLLLDFRANERVCRLSSVVVMVMVMVVE
jgi:hypothetical protein